MIKSLLISLIAIASINIYLLKSKRDVKNILKDKGCKVDKIKDNLMICNCNGEYIELYFDDDSICIWTRRYEKNKI
jgi:hypothetical protein